MAVYLIDTVRPKNGLSFPIALSNEIYGGLHYANSLQERNAIPSERRVPGMLCYVLGDTYYRLADNYLDITEENDKWLKLEGIMDKSTTETVTNLNEIEEPFEGQIAFVRNDEDMEYMYFYDGTQWKPFDTYKEPSVPYNFVTTSREEMEDLSIVHGSALPVGAMCCVTSENKDENGLFFFDGEQWTSVSIGSSNIDISTELEEKADKEHTHKYSDIVDPPVIPSIEGLATETYVLNKIAEAELNDKEVDLSGYATQDDLLKKSDVGHSHDYSELTGMPELPSLEGYATTTYVGTAIDEEMKFEKDAPVVTSLGGIQAGENLNGLDVKQILNKLLFPYVAPVINASLSMSPSGTLFEHGTTVTLVSMTGNVTKKSESIENVKFHDTSTGTQLHAIFDNVDKSDSYTHMFSPPVTITSNLPSSRFRFSVTDGMDKTYYANSTTINFCYPYYFGVADENVEINSDLITKMTKRVEQKGTKSYNYTSNQQAAYIAYPTSYGKLTKIIDANGFDVTDTFTQHEILVVGLDGTEQSYYVYRDKNATSTNFKITFYY